MTSKDFRKSILFQTGKQYTPTTIFVGRKQDPRDELYVRSTEYPLQENIRDLRTNGFIYRKSLPVAKSNYRLTSFMNDTERTLLGFSTNSVNADGVRLSGLSAGARDELFVKHKTPLFPPVKRERENFEEQGDNFDFGNRDSDMYRLFYGDEGRDLPDAVQMAITNAIRVGNEDLANHIGEMFNDLRNARREGEVKGDDISVDLREYIQTLERNLINEITTANQRLRLDITRSQGYLSGASKESQQTLLDMLSAISKDITVYAQQRASSPAGAPDEALLRQQENLAREYMALVAEVRNSDKLDRERNTKLIQNVLEAHLKSLEEALTRKEALDMTSQQDTLNRLINDLQGIISSQGDPNTGRVLLEQLMVRTQEIGTILNTFIANFGVFANYDASMKEKLTKFIETESQKMSAYQSTAQPSMPPFTPFKITSENDLLRPEILKTYQQMREFGLIPPTLYTYNYPEEFVGNYSQARNMLDSKLDPEDYDTTFNFFGDGKMFAQKEERGTFRVISTKEEVKYFPSLRKYYTVNSGREVYQEKSGRWFTENGLEVGFDNTTTLIQSAMVITKAPKFTSAQELITFYELISDNVILPLNDQVGFELLKNIDEALPMAPYYGMMLGGYFSMISRTDLGPDTFDLMPHYSIHILTNFLKTGLFQESRPFFDGWLDNEAKAIMKILEARDLEMIKVGNGEMPQPTNRADIPPPLQLLSASADPIRTKKDAQVVSIYLKDPLNIKDVSARSLTVMKELQARFKYEYGRLSALGLIPISPVA